MTISNDFRLYNNIPKLGVLLVIPYERYPLQSKSLIIFNSSNKTVYKIMQVTNDKHDIKKGEFSDENSTTSLSHHHAFRRV